MAKIESKKKEVNIIVTQPIESARMLRTIAENKGFPNRKKYIEYLCEQQVQQYINKQLKLKL